MLGKTRLAAGMEEKKVVTVTATTNARTGLTIPAISVLEAENRIEYRRPVFLKVHPRRILLNIAIIERSYFPHLLIPSKSFTRGLHLRFVTVVLQRQS